MQSEDQKPNRPDRLFFLRISRNLQGYYIVLYSVKFTVRGTPCLYRVPYRVVTYFASIEVNFIQKHVLHKLGRCTLTTVFQPKSI